jgi:peptidoglycan hydrolase-like protein with peptidoglycan-binding domain
MGGDVAEEWVELDESEELDHDEPVGSDADLDPEGYDPGDDPASEPVEAPEPAPDGADAEGARIRLPVSKAAIPSWAKDLGNGQIPLDRMIKVAPIGSGYLVPEAAAAWRNLQNAAAAAGFTLTMTGAYRTYEGQKALFQDRYVTSDTGRSSKVWNNTRYWLKRGMAMAAVPGTSNHGWGCAVDTALDGYGNAARSVDWRFLSWALDRAAVFGWSWEVQSEPWHVRLVSFERTTDTTTTTTTTTTTQTVHVPPPPTLRVGSRGGQVAALQNLCRLFRWGDPGRADGWFGPRTKAAVQAMQGAIGAVPDGIYGPRSAAALKAALAAMPPG